MPMLRPWARRRPHHSTSDAGSVDEPAVVGQDGVAADRVLEHEPLTALGVAQRLLGPVAARSRRAPR